MPDEESSVVFSHGHLPLASDDRDSAKKRERTVERNASTKGTCPSSVRDPIVGAVSHPRSLKTALPAAIPAPSSEKKAARRSRKAAAAAAVAAAAEGAAAGTVGAAEGAVDEADIATPTMTPASRPGGAALRLALLPSTCIEDDDNGTLEPPIEQQIGGAHSTRRRIRARVPDQISRGASQAASPVG